MTATRPFIRSAARSATLMAALLLGSATLLTSCAVEEAPPPVEETAAAATHSMKNPAGAMPQSCQPYDPSYCDPSFFCEVPSQYVQCSRGIVMFAWATPDCRYCIDRDVCGSNEPVCPF